MRLVWWCKILWTIAAIAILLAASPPAGMIALIIVVAVKVAPRNQQQSTSHGSALWADLKALWNAGCLNSEGGVYVGRAIPGKPVSRFAGLKAMLQLPWRHSKEAAQFYENSRGRPTEAEVFIPDSIPHCAVYGATGSAKTTSYAIPLLLRSTDTCIVMDPKGELAKLTAGHRQKEFDHRVVVLDPYGVTRGSGLSTDRINPLDCFRHDPQRLVDDARRLAGAIVGGRSEGESDPYWNDSATMFITAVLSFLMAIGREGTSLSQARDVTCSTEMIEEMVRLMKESDACNGLLRRLAGEVDGLQGKTRSSVISVANSHLSFLDSIPTADLLSESTFDPAEIIDGKVTLYLCLPVDRLQELSSLQRVIMTTLINLVFTAGEDRNRRVRFVLDEAATLQESEAIYSMIMFGRSYGLRAMMLFQSVSQLDRCFPESRKADFLATVAGIHCGCDDLASAKDVSEWCGKQTIVTASEQQGLNHGGSHSTGINDPSQNQNWGRNDSTSYSETGRELITAAEVLQLPKDRALVLLPHIPPILALKTPYFLKTAKRRAARLLTASLHFGVLVGTGLAMCIGVLLLLAHSQPDFVKKLRTAGAEFVYGIQNF
ncbi:MAG: type IV secretory system conjugative DNA transfer family protein [Fuerstiella sp.]